jgi:hypothetical protein
MMERGQKLDYTLVSSLEREPLMAERLQRLRTVPDVSPITVSFRQGCVTPSESDC